MTRRIRFFRDGRAIHATEGQSIAAALWAHGDRVLSRSTKYHRPRGLSCGIGKCADCHMRVDGVPNVKTCITPVQDGMVVEGQNAWPNVRTDLFRVNDLVWARGFDHHRAFLRPRFLYPLFGAVIRRFAGWGRLPDAPAADPMVEELRPQVAVIGAGPAGLAAAEAAATAGASVLLLEENVRPGGAALRLGHRLDDPDDPGHEVDAATLSESWTRTVQDHDRIDLRTRTAVSAAYRGGILLARAPDRILALKAQAVVVATGGYAAEALFEGNDRPGVLRATAVGKLLHQEQVTPGKRAVVYGAGADGLRTALDLHRTGIEVRAVVEPHDEPPAPRPLRDAVADAGIPIWCSSTVRAAKGWARVKAVQVERPEGRRRVACDLIVVALGRKTTPEFFQALGAQLRYDPERGGAVPVLSETLETNVPGLFAVGDTAGIGGLRTARLSGRLAGAAAAAQVLGTGGAELGDLQAALRAASDRPEGPYRLEVMPA